MTIEEKKLEGYITLKEASEIFGYSPDYIGQLIRKGKIEGKQVYANVAWMTTSDSLEKYLEREKGASNEKDNALRPSLANRLFSEKGMFIVLWALRALIPLLVILLLFVFYFISITIDHRLSLRAEQRLIVQNAQNGERIAVNLSAKEHLTYDK